jgi:hypothetical protein
MHDRCGAAPAEARATVGRPVLPEAVSSVPGSPGGLHDFADEALGLTAWAVPDASRPDAQIVVMDAQRGTC